MPGQAANGVDAASSTPTPSDRKEKKDKKDKSEKKDKKDKSHKKEKKSKKEKKDKDHERSDASPVRSPASVEMTAGTPSQLPGEPAATESKETVAVDPPEPESKQKNTLNAKSLAALNRANTCDLMQQGEIPAEVDDSSKSERLDLSDRTKSIRHAHLNKFGRSLKSSELISVIFSHEDIMEQQTLLFQVLQQFPASAYDPRPQHPGGDQNPGTKHSGRPAFRCCTGIHMCQNLAINNWKIILALVFGLEGLWEVLEALRKHD